MRLRPVSGYGPLLGLETCSRRICRETAINEIGDKPLDIRQKSGPDSVYWFGSVKLASEAAYLNRKLAALWVTNNFDYQPRICHFIAGADRGTVSTWSRCN